VSLRTPSLVRTSVEKIWIESLVCATRLLFSHTATNSVDEATKDGEDCGGGLIFDALVQGVYDDDARDVHERERIHDQVLELRYK